jgi:N,N'-diacetyllegionaminate synthase
MSDMILGGENTTIIAETACAHEGDTQRLLRFVDAVSDSLADTIKFHAFTADGRAVPGTEYHTTVSNLEISDEQWAHVIKQARENGLNIVADVFDIKSAKLMDKLGIDAFKIHAADIQNTPLLETVAETETPVILYIGGSTLVEITESIRQLKRYDCQKIALMYGLQNYPTSFENSNLGKISILNERFEFPIGYASHAAGGSKQAKKLPAYAAASGADLIECHMSLNRKNKRVDYISSLNPTEFDEMIREVREVETAVGTPTFGLTDAEKRYRQGVRKSVYTRERIDSGSQITKDNIAYLRGDEDPDQYPIKIEQVVGKHTNKSIEKYTPIKMTDIDVKTTAALACRSESTRLYGKPLQLVGEKPILQHIVDGLRTVPNLDEIVLAIADTPSQSSYIDFAERNNIEYVIGPEIDVLHRCISVAQETESDFIVKANTENPYVGYKLIKDAISTIIETNADLVAMENLPLGSAVDTVSTEALLRSHEHGDERHQSEFTSRFILENSDSFNIETITPPEKLQRPDVRLTVDYPADLILAREIKSRLDIEADYSYLPLQSVISVLEANPELKSINDQYDDGTNTAIKQERPFMYGNDKS